MLSRANVCPYEHILSTNHCQLAQRVEPLSLKKSHVREIIWLYIFPFMAPKACGTYCLFLNKASLHIQSCGVVGQTGHFFGTTSVIFYLQTLNLYCKLDLVSLVAKYLCVTIYFMPTPSGFLTMFCSTQSMGLSYPDCCG